MLYIGFKFCFKEISFLHLIMSSESFLEQNEEQLLIAVFITLICMLFPCFFGYRAFLFNLNIIFKKVVLLFFDE